MSPRTMLKTKLRSSSGKPASLPPAGARANAKPPSSAVARVVSVGRLRIGAGQPLALIAGPCVIESETHAMDMAVKLEKIASVAGIPLIFKASYDKANRSSLTSYRGPGLEAGLAVLRKIKER